MFLVRCLDGSLLSRIFQNFCYRCDKIIVNETAGKIWGLKILLANSLKPRRHKTLQIIGVIKDMIVGSPYEPEKRGIFFWTQISNGKSN